MENDFVYSFSISLRCKAFNNTTIWAICVRYATPTKGALHIYKEVINCILIIIFFATNKLFFWFQKDINLYILWWKDVIVKEVWSGAQKIAKIKCALGLWSPKYDTNQRRTESSSMIWWDEMWTLQEEWLQKR